MVVTVVVTGWVIVVVDSDVSVTVRVTVRVTVVVDFVFFFGFGQLWCLVLWHLGGGFATAPETPTIATGASTIAAPTSHVARMRME